MLTTKDALALRFALMAREHVQAVGRRMRERREELGLTQREVADRMPPPIDGNYISRWERGEHKPEDETLDQLAVALETTTARLLTDSVKAETDTPDLSRSQTQLDRVEKMVQTVLDNQRLILLELKRPSRQRRTPPPKAGGKEASGS